MKTKTFTNLIERAMVECYGAENGSEFDLVPYIEDGQTTPPKTCLGIFLNDVVHMASVASQAMLYLAQDLAKARADGRAEDGNELLDDMQDFTLLMQLFRVAPYMQWTCIYFPGLTHDCEDTDDMGSEASE